MVIAIYIYFGKFVSKVKQNQYVPVLHSFVKLLSVKKKDIATRVMQTTNY